MRVIKTFKRLVYVTSEGDPFSIRSLIQLLWHLVKSRGVIKQSIILTPEGDFKLRHEVGDQHEFITFCKGDNIVYRVTSKTLLKR